MRGFEKTLPLQIQYYRGTDWFPYGLSVSLRSFIRETERLNYEVEGIAVSGETASVLFTVETHEHEDEGLCVGCLTIPSSFSKRLGEYLNVKVYNA